jgi:CRISPR-associated protein Cas1
MKSSTPSTLHISGYGKKLKKHNNSLVVEWKEGENSEKASFTPSKLEDVILSGEHSISTGAIRLLFENNVSLSCMDSFGNPIGYLFPHAYCQYMNIWEKQLSIDSIHKLDIAKNICLAGATNKKSILQTIQNSRDIELGEFVASIENIIDKMYDVSHTDSLMGYEGSAANAYFEALKLIIPARFEFERRIKHPSPDPVNVLLSYGYGILYSKIRAAINKAKLNPYRGVLHSNYRNQEGLVYDLIEEFRQPVVDRVVLTMIGRNQVHIDYFSNEGGFCRIDNSFKKIFANMIFSRLESETIYRDGKKTFQDIIDLQAIEYQKAIVEGYEYEPFMYRRR